MWLSDISFLSYLICQVIYNAFDYTWLHYVFGHSTENLQDENDTSTYKGRMTCSGLMPVSNFMEVWHLFQKLLQRQHMVMMIPCVVEGWRSTCGVFSFCGWGYHKVTPFTIWSFIMM